MVPCLRFLGSIQLKKRGKRSSVNRACIGSCLTPSHATCSQQFTPFQVLNWGGCVNGTEPGSRWDVTLSRHWDVTPSLGPPFMPFTLSIEQWLARTEAVA